MPKLKRQGDIDNRGATDFVESLDRGHEPRVPGVDEPDLGHEQNAGVELLAAEALGEGAPLVAPRAAENGFAHGRGTRVPQRRALAKRQRVRDLREGYRGPVPAEYREQLRAYSEGVSRGRTDAE